MKKTLTIAWLYPDLMSTYGDRGNIIVLEKRCQWREIATTVLPIGIGTPEKKLQSCDMILMGGAEDRQQQIVADDFAKGKNKTLATMIEQGIPGLYICGAFQFLGKEYKEADGTIIHGLGILDMHTKNPGTSHKRLIGNILVESEIQGEKKLLVGFENHGGRSYLGGNLPPLGKVIKGFGNNEKDQQEGAIYHNSIGTYLHGPVLPKNPFLADWLIQKALEKKYKTTISLNPLDDTMENQARDIIVQKLS